MTPPQRRRKNAKTRMVDRRAAGMLNLRGAAGFAFTSSIDCINLNKARALYEPRDKLEHKAIIRLTIWCRIALLQSRSSGIVPAQHRRHPTADVPRSKYSCQTKDRPHGRFASASRATLPQALTRWTFWPACLDRIHLGRTNGLCPMAGTPARAHR